MITFMKSTWMKPSRFAQDSGNNRSKNCRIFQIYPTNRGDLCGGSEAHLCVQSLWVSDTVCLDFKLLRYATKRIY